MSKQIIVLERNDIGLSYKVAFWATVPATRKSYYANTDATSQYKDISAGELTSIKDGSVIEKVDNYYYAQGTALSAIKSDLIAKFNDWQGYITNYNPYDRYGTFYDGTWTNGGVA